jgi:hypothetical protein
MANNRLYSYEYLLILFAMEHNPAEAAGTRLES